MKEIDTSNLEDEFLAAAQELHEAGPPPYREEIRRRILDNRISGETSFAGRALRRAGIWLRLERVGEEALASAQKSLKHQGKIETRREAVIDHMPAGELIYIADPTAAECA